MRVPSSVLANCPLKTERTVDPAFAKNVAKRVKAERANHGRQMPYAFGNCPLASSQKKQRTPGTPFMKTLRAPVFGSTKSAM